MIRYGLGILVATTACAAVGLAACGDTIKDGGGPTGTGGAAGGGGGASTSGGSGNGGAKTDSGPGTGALTPCTAACCPTDVSCYSGPDGQHAPGAECQATHDNTGQAHIQMRQAWINALTPAGNTLPIVYGILANRTELPAATCNQGGNLTYGDGGYIQLIDFYLGGSQATPPDPTKDYSTVGYARFVTKDTLADTLTNGFCMGAELEHATAKYALSTADVTPADVDSYPPGLPHPMGALDGFNVGITKAKRVLADFDVTADRLKLLAMFDDTNPANIKKDGFSGVFFYNPKTGYAHGFGALGWTVVYTSDHTTHISIPIREVETKSTFNDPTHPDCVGAYMASKLDPSTCRSADKTKPAWGCLNDACPSYGAPATTEGYFLISELDQIYTGDLRSTLCVSYPGKSPTTNNYIVQDQGFYNSVDTSCRSGTWNAKLAKGAGMPKGDWCAATNSAATADCHDAWHSISHHVFVGGKIKLVGDATTDPATCKFSP